MKRFSLGLVAFSMPFVIALCVPSLRTLMRVQMLGSMEMLPPQVPWSNSFENREVFKASRLLPLHPDDVRVQAMAAQEDRLPRASDNLSVSEGLALGGSLFEDTDDYGAKRGRRVCAAYDELIARHPREAWLIAKRLRLTTVWLSDNRMAGELEDSTYPPHQPALERDARHRSTFNARDLSTAIAAAKLGRQLEPDNSYFDWMLALFLMQSTKDGDAWIDGPAIGCEDGSDIRLKIWDKEAFQALHQASLKARYDEHLGEEARAIIGVKELVRPRLLEEKIMDDASLLSPQLARFRHLARMVAWQALKWERAGKTNEGLELRLDLARASAPMMRGNSILITGLVGAAMQSIAWHRSVGKRPTQDQLRALGLDSGTGGYNTFYVRGFVRDARAQHRPDLAAEALKLDAQAAKFRRASHGAYESGDGSMTFGVAAALMSRVRSLWWLSLAFLAQMALLAGGWLIVSLVLIRRRVPRGEAPQASLPISSRDLLKSVVPCAFVTLLLSAWAMQRGINNDFFMQLGTMPSNTDWVSGLILLAAGVLSPVAVGALICGLATGLRMRRVLGRQERLPSAMGRERSSRHDGMTARHQGGEINSLLWTVATLSVASLSIGGLLTSLGTLFLRPSGFEVPLPWPGATLAAGDLGQASLTTGVIASVLWLVGWIIKARWLTAPALRPLSLHGLNWFRSTLAAFLIVSSWAYLGALCLSVVPRQQADAAFNTFLERGEIGMLSSPSSKSIDIE